MCTLRSCYIEYFSLVNLIKYHVWIDYRIRNGLIPKLNCVLKFYKEKCKVNFNKILNFSYFTKMKFKIIKIKKNQILYTFYDSEYLLHT